MLTICETNILLFWADRQDRLNGCREASILKRALMQTCLRRCLFLGIKHGKSLYANEWG